MGHGQEASGCEGKSHEFFHCKRLSRVSCGQVLARDSPRQITDYYKELVKGVLWGRWWNEREPNLRLAQGRGTFTF